jgi:hypothetical protein
LKYVKTVATKPPMKADAGLDVLNSIKNRTTKMMVPEMDSLRVKDMFSK